MPKPDIAKAMPGKHIPVLLYESIEALELGEGKTFLDGTFGAGGHSREALRRFPKGLRIVALDQDPSATARAAEIPGIEFFNKNFRDLDQLFHMSDMWKGEGNVDAILLDLGFSSDQMDLSGRGFSFLRDEPLDMRMSRAGITAADILNSWDEHAIELVLRGFGEEKASRKIAEEIVQRREAKPFRTTFDLVDAVLAARPRRLKDKIHPATKTFQALRIAVNEELTALEEGLRKGFEALRPGGRFVVISFHSLEDRIVKNFFRDMVKEEKAIHIIKKAVMPSVEEVSANPRSRSAKLRAIEKK